MKKCSLIVIRDEETDQITQIVAAYSDKNIAKGKENFNFMKRLKMEAGAKPDFIEVEVGDKQIGAVPESVVSTKNKGSRNNGAASKGTGRMTVKKKEEEILIDGQTSGSDDIQMENQS